MNVSPAIEYLTLYLDHPKVGCGYRRFLVLKKGRVEAKLLCVETAESLSLPVGLLQGGTPETYKPRRLIKRIKATARTYHREDSWAVKNAVKLLKSAPAH